jgi:hypothetical protein
MPVKLVTAETTFPEGYREIIVAASRAAYRAGAGKGRQRHADHDNQPIMEQRIARYTHGWRLDQMDKKIGEVPRLRKLDRINELLDVIVLAAVEIRVLEKEISEEANRREAGRKIKLEVADRPE